MILKTKTDPLPGDYKVVTKFAWFPKWVGKEKIWLQKYQLFYEYKMCKRTIILRGCAFTLNVHDWCLIDQKIVDHANT